MGDAELSVARRRIAGTGTWWRDRCLGSTERRTIRDLGESLVFGALLNRNGRRRIVLRKAFFDVAGFATPALLVEGEAASFWVSTSDRVVSRETFAVGSYEDHVMARAIDVLIRYGHPVQDRAFVDVGANIGTSTIPAVLRYGASRAVAVEPEIENFRLLRFNTLLNGLEGRVELVQAAASDSAGFGWLSLSPHNSGDHRIVAPSTVHGEDRSRQKTEVRLDLLDNIIAQRGLESSEIGVVWMDAQGFEGYILAGSPNLIASGVPFVCEYWPHGLRSGQEASRSSTTS